MDNDGKQTPARGNEPELPPETPEEKVARLELWVDTLRRENANLQTRLDRFRFPSRVWMSEVR